MTEKGITEQTSESKTKTFRQQSLSIYRTRIHPELISNQLT